MLLTLSTSKATTLTQPLEVTCFRRINRSCF